MASQYLPRTVAITVTGGSGTALIPKDYSGPCTGIAITPPGALATTTFDFEVFDSASIGQIGEVECLGPTTRHQRIQLHDGGSIDLTNCSADGAWTLRLWYDE
jgi:hypothetical protein